MKYLVLFGVIAAALAAPVPDEKVVAVHGAVAPAALTYGAHALTHAVAPGAVSYAAPALTHAVAPAAVSYATPAVHHAVAPTAVSYAAPAVHHAVAPAAVSYAAPAVHHAVAPAVAYATPTPVALPPAEVKVPVTRTHVEVPVHQKVHYGTQNYVAGATTTIHKPSLAAPAIAPPSTLLAKVTHNAPELTIQRQEVPVEKHTPNFVDTPYHAGTIVKYTEPEVREVKVPTPYAQPVAVPQPIAVPQPVPVPHAVPFRHTVHSVAVHNAVPAVHAAPAAVVKADY
ncbi:cuticle protein 16.5-like [Penaeus vannamei]|uniref:cuticle protein 16.5-like n=1 Tax=Penaeus vannamei TaxID=6689 RepID=UPI00387F8760